MYEYFNGLYVAAALLGSGGALVCEVWKHWDDGADQSVTVPPVQPQNGSGQGTQTESFEEQPQKNDLKDNLTQTEPAKTEKLEIAEYRHFLDSSRKISNLETRLLEAVEAISSYDSEQSKNRQKEIRSDEEISNLRKKNDEHQERNKKLEAELEKARSASKASSSEDSSMLSETQQKLKDAKADLAEAHEAHEALVSVKRELTETGDKLSKQQTELRTASNALQIVKGEAVNAQTLADSTRKELNTAMQELNTAKQELNTAKQELNTAKQELNTAKQQSKKQEEKKKEAQEWFNTIEEGLKQKREALNSLDDGLEKERRDRKKNLDEETAAEKRERRKKLDEEIAKEKRESGAADPDESKKKKKKRGDIKASDDEVKEQKRKEVDALDKQVEDKKQADFKAIDEELQTKQQALATLQKALEEGESDKSQLRKDIDAANQESNQALEALKATKNEVGREIAAARETLTTTQASNAEEQEKLKTLETKTAEQHSSFDSEKLRLQTELREAGNNLQNVNNQVAAAQKVLNDTRARVQLQQRRDNQTHGIASPSNPAAASNPYAAHNPQSTSFSAPADAQRQPFFEAFSSQQANNAPFQFGLPAQNKAPSAPTQASNSAESMETGAPVDNVTGQDTEDIMEGIDKGDVDMDHHESRGSVTTDYAGPQQAQQGPLSGYAPEATHFETAAEDFDMGEAPSSPEHRVATGAQASQPVAISEPRFEIGSDNPANPTADGHPSSPRGVSEDLADYLGWSTTTPSPLDGVNEHAGEELSKTLHEWSAANGPSHDKELGDSDTSPTVAASTMYDPAGTFNNAEAPAASTTYDPAGTSDNAEAPAASHAITTGQAHQPDEGDESDEDDEITRRLDDEDGAARGLAPTAKLVPHRPVGARRSVPSSSAPSSQQQRPNAPKDDSAAARQHDEDDEKNEDEDRAARGLTARPKLVPRRPGGARPPMPSSSAPSLQQHRPNAPEDDSAAAKPPPQREGPSSAQQVNRSRPKVRAIRPARPRPLPSDSEVQTFLRSELEIKGHAPSETRLRQYFAIPDDDSRSQRFIEQLRRLGWTDSMEPLPSDREVEDYFLGRLQEIVTTAETCEHLGVSPDDDDDERYVKFRRQVAELRWTMLPLNRELEESFQRHGEQTAEDYCEEFGIDIGDKRLYYEAFIKQLDRLGLLEEEDAADEDPEAPEAPEAPKDPEEDSGSETALPSEDEIEEIYMAAGDDTEVTITHLCKELGIPQRDLRLYRRFCDQLDKLDWIVVGLPKDDVLQDYFGDKQQSQVTMSEVCDFFGVPEDDKVLYNRLRDQLESLGLTASESVEVQSPQGSDKDADGGSADDDKWLLGAGDSDPNDGNSDEGSDSEDDGARSGDEGEGIPTF